MWVALAKPGEWNNWFNCHVQTLPLQFNVVVAKSRINGLVQTSVHTTMFIIVVDESILAWT